METASPFIPGTNHQYAWDSTSLGWSKECLRKYYYAMILGISPMGESIHLRFGILYHEVTELFDTLIIQHVPHEDAVRKCVRWILENTVVRRDDKCIPWDTGHASKTRENLVRTFVWYTEHFRNDPTKTIVLPSGKPAIELSFRLDLNMPAPNGQHYFLTGHMDKLIDYEGSIFVMDKKTTTSRLNERYFKQYNPDNQMSAYTLAGRLIFNAPVGGVIIDAAQIVVGYTDFKRAITYRTPEQLQEWLEDTREHLLAVERAVERNKWPHNDKSCHNYDGCPFRDICETTPYMREHVIKTKYVKRIWNPLESRE